MRLISLSCDQPSFKTLRFRPSGISVIVGDATDHAGSANGVGKTLALALVHHCLGASKGAFPTNGIEHWQFALQLEIAGSEHRIERSADSSDIRLDGCALKLPALRDWLDQCGAFVLPAEELRNGLSFRSLYGRFARRNPKDCLDPVQLEKEQSHEALLRTLYLLGADISLVQSKHLLREQMRRIDDTLKLFRQRDGRLDELLRTGMDAQMQVANLTDRITVLRQRLDSMQVAEDYEQVRQEADALTAKVRDCESQEARIDFQLSGIARSLEMRPDVEREALLSFYSGLERVFKKEALAHFETVEKFHQSLATQRRNRLLRDQMDLQARQVAIKAERVRLAHQRDSRLAFLRQRHALDDYMAVVQELARMEADLARLEQYNNAENNWQTENVRLRETLTQDDKQAVAYLRTQPLASADQQFRTLVHALYPQEKAGIVLNNNTGNNKLRYDLKVQVERQASDGINAARVMTFDWLIFRHGAHHTMRHLWHDNGLFDHVDPNQRAAWLRLVRGELTGSDMQYIISINTENFDSMRERMEADEAKLLDDAVIARLQGNDDRNKLLGVRIGTSAPTTGA